jgi:hypothetical protein
MKNHFTRSILFGLSLFISIAVVKAQNSTGLQNIIVEKYYVSDADDAAASVGVLPVGSVTYRIFVDMKQGYKFQAAYGSPAHSLFIKTTTSFFNNEDRGGVTPTYTKTQAKNNTVMLDSWLSGGAACAGNYGVLKSDDDGIATIVNADGILKNTDAMAGIPLTDQDGLKTGTPGSFSKVGIDDAITVFDATSQAGNSFVISNGAWSCIEGAVGSDTTNIVLIAQITTKGEFSFELNIQLGTPSGGTEQFVAKDAVDLETMFPGLTYISINTGLTKPGTKPDRNQDMVSVFPNPTSGIISLNVKSEKTHSNNQLTIYNVVGKAVLKKNIENISGDFTDKLDISEFPDGMYFVEMLLDGKKSTIKLIKK